MNVLKVVVKQYSIYMNMTENVMKIVYIIITLMIKIIIIAQLIHHVQMNIQN